MHRGRALEHSWFPCKADANMGLDIQEVYWGNAREGQWGWVGMREALGLELDPTPAGESRKAGLRKVLKAAVQFGENLSQAKGSEQKLLFRRAPYWQE